MCAIRKNRVGQRPEALRQVARHEDQGGRRTSLIFFRRSALGMSAAFLLSVSMRDSPAGSGWGATARRILAGAALLLAAFSSLATSPESCPQTVSLSDTATVEPDLPAGQHYTVTGSWKVHVLVTAASTDPSEVRIRLEPDFATTPGDGGPDSAVDLAVRPGVKSSADLELPYCSSDCGEPAFSVIVEHLAGAAATLNWEVFAETDNCSEEFHVLIERR
jgi:hypothetical protein